MVALLSSANLLLMLPAALAAFEPGSTANVAVYWGQNSIQQGSGPNAQQRLSLYCENSNIGIIPLAFMNGISPPIVNFANADSNCTASQEDANIESCPQLEEDIKSCQKTYRKTILLSLAGATYSQGGWSSSGDAEKAAQLVWDMFGPAPSGSTVRRPFGSAVVDGFDFDFESTANNLPAFGRKLRSLMDASGDKKYYLSAAPQCVFPDAAVGTTLDAVPFDFVMIQFYNNDCGVSNFQQSVGTENKFNFGRWDSWARSSKNPSVKLLLGIPAAPGAGGGYASGSQLKAAIQYARRYSSFGGVMMWDVSQLYSNNGFLSEVVSDMEGGQLTTLPPVGTITNPGTALPTSSSLPILTGAFQEQYAQCGGNWYTGPTVCKAPYTCVRHSEWWSSCK